MLNIDNTITDVPDVYYIQVDVLPTSKLTQVSDVSVEMSNTKIFNNTDESRGSI